jgi:hypothetical protein
VSSTKQAPPPPAGHAETNVALCEGKRLFLVPKRLSLTVGIEQGQVHLQRSLSGLATGLQRWHALRGKRRGLVASIAGTASRSSEA